MKRCSAMRIYAVADIHGKPEKITLVREKTEDLKPDALVVAGDITNYFFGRFHAGCRRLYHLVLHRQPRLVLCGHIHERPGIASIMQTTVVNCCVSRTARGAMVDFDPDGSPLVEML